MTTKRLGPAIGAAIVLVLCVLLPAPAQAQLGSLHGRVVDEAGAPVPEAEITFEYSGERNYRFTAKSNAKGEFVRAGLYSVGGRWTVSAKKGNLAGFVSNIDVPLSATGEIGDIVVKAGGRVAEANKGQSDAEREEDAKQQLALKKIFEEANAALSSSSYDVAITKLNEALTKVPQCGICYLRIGDVQAKKKDFDAAEAAYKKALEIDPKSVEAYDGLAVVYNTQRKFAEAGEATTKATALRSAGGTSAGDAGAAYNAGAILMNQGKASEAKVQFQRAMQLDPKMGEAYYQYAMTLLNEGNVAEAVKTLDQYLVIAPTGPNAEAAKGMLPELKKMIK
jgi:tetratricopeptide (TPR) repeat protein